MCRVGSKQSTRTLRAVTPDAVRALAPDTRCINGSTTPTPTRPRSSSCSTIDIERPLEDSEAAKTIRKCSGSTAESESARRHLRSGSTDRNPCVLDERMAPGAPEALLRTSRSSTDPRRALTMFRRAATRELRDPMNNTSKIQVCRSVSHPLHHPRHHPRHHSHGGTPSSTDVSPTSGRSRSMTCST